MTVVALVVVIAAAWQGLSIPNIKPLERVYGFAWKLAAFTILAIIVTFILGLWSPFGDPDCVAWVEHGFDDACEGDPSEFRDNP